MKIHHLLALFILAFISLACNLAVTEPPQAVTASSGVSCVPPEGFVPGPLETPYFDPNTQAITTYDCPMGIFAKVQKPIDLHWLLKARAESGANPFGEHVTDGIHYFAEDLPLIEFASNDTLETALLSGPAPVILWERSLSNNVSVSIHQRIGEPTEVFLTEGMVVMLAQVTPEGYWFELDGKAYFASNRDAGVEFVPMILP